MLINVGRFNNNSKPNLLCDKGPGVAAGSGAAKISGVHCRRRPTEKGNADASGISVRLGKHGIHAEPRNYHKLN
jgi:hypothetical protein